VESACDSPWIWGFEPGDAVRIVESTFVGSAGTVLSYEDVRERFKREGRTMYRPDNMTLWVLIEVYGQPLLVQLQSFQVEHT